MLTPAQTTPGSAERKSVSATGSRFACADVLHCRTPATRLSVANVLSDFHAEGAACTGVRYFFIKTGFFY